ncbi:MAG: formate dehydrogenase accessory sulfurtransferase FdhD [Acidobacteriaceae bacterium]|nr:formate dehydrogenase accessory sulfurtransferase FdhD [Acidobacteriaceae bacterium]MBV9780496.1 formate dehydrogenase accessory sulfurtransferase FdhD [Acidobacteriaceae bacterium]
MNPAVVQVPIQRVEGSKSARLDDRLAVEEPLEIRVGGESLSITMRTPGEDAELAAGFLFSEGMIRDISEIRFEGQPSEGNRNIIALELVNRRAQPGAQGQRNFLMTSACGVCGKASLQDLRVSACPVLPKDDIQLEAETIHSLPDRLRQAQSAFDTTGGLHAAARFNLRGDLESLREDVGRHNALDKLIGAALLAYSVPLRNSILVVSGRASFELVQKALMAGFPILAAVGAPSSLAVETAEGSGMTLIGFLRNGRFNVYAGSDRVCGLVDVV